MGITGLTKWADGQWTWWIGGEREHYYRTNEIGQGLFQVSDATLDVQQLTGTCQFSLAGCSKHAAYMRIKRYWE